MKPTPSGPTDGDLKPRDQSVPLYSGGWGATVYGLFVLGVGAAVVLVMSLLVGALVNVPGVAGVFLMRLLLVVVLCAVVSGVSRYLAQARFQTLWGLKLQRGDAGGLTGLLAGLMAVGAWSSDRLSPTDENSPIAVGEVIQIEGPTSEGSIWKLADQSGKVVLVDFWATWCGPCVDEIPQVAAAYEKFHDQGLEVVGVSLDRSVRDLQAFLADHPEPWPQIHFGDREDNPLAERYRIEGIPLLVVIGRDGRVMAADVRGAEIEQACEAAIQGKTWRRDPWPIGGVLKPLAWITTAALLAPPWLLAGGLLVTGILGAMLEVRLRRPQAPLAQSSSAVA